MKEFEPIWTFFPTNAPGIITVPSPISDEELTISFVSNEPRSSWESLVKAENGFSISKSTLPDGDSTRSFTSTQLAAEARAFLMYLELSQKVTSPFFTQWISLIPVS